MLKSRIPQIIATASLSTQRAVNEAGLEVEFHALQAAGVRRDTGEEQRKIKWKVGRDPYMGFVNAGTFYTRFSEYGTVNQAARPIMGPAAEAVDQNFVAAVTVAWRDA